MSRLSATTDDRTATRGGTTLVVGLGSAQGDDRLGWVVAERLTAAHLPRATVRAAATPAALLDWIDAATALVLCDACRGTGGPAGSLHRWQWPTRALASLRSASSHQLSVTDVLQLADRLARLPSRVVIWGAEIADCRPGDDLSPAAARAIDSLIDAISREVRHA